MQKIIDKIKNSQKIALFGHTWPDWDAVWSMLGMWYILEKLGKNVSYWTPDQTPQNLSFIDWIQKIRADFDFGQYDFLFFLDFHDFIRIEDLHKKNPKYFEDNDKVVIDHHIWDLKYNADAIIDEDAISTCELVWEFVNFARPKLIDKKFAEYLYIWHTTDSGNFLYDTDHIRTMSNALQMLKFGVNKTQILSDLFFNKDLQYIENYKYLIQKVQRTKKIIRFWVSEEEIEKYNIDWFLVKNILSFTKSINDFDIQIAVNQKSEKFKLNIRSKKTDITKIVEQFGWWWHKNASWLDLYFGQKYKWLDWKIFEIEKWTYQICIDLIESFL